MSSTNESPILRAWENLQTWLESREERERKIIAGVVCAVVALAWYQWFAAPALLEQKGLNAKAEALDGELRQIGLDVAQVKAELKRDPNVRLREQIAQLELQSKRLDERVGQLSATWMTPAEMSKALRRVLSARGKLKLLSLTSEEPSMLGVEVGAKPAKVEGEAEGGQFAVFQHGMELVVEGQFFDVLTYLETLEGSDWSFHWDALEYSVETFPTATVTLRLQTYSAERGWIGV